MGQLRPFLIILFQTFSFQYANKFNLSAEWWVLQNFIIHFQHFKPKLLIYRWISRKVVVTPYPKFLVIIMFSTDMLYSKFIILLILASYFTIQGYLPTVKEVLLKWLKFETKIIEIKYVPKYNKINSLLLVLVHTNVITSKFTLFPANWKKIWRSAYILKTLSHC